MSYIKYVFRYEYPIIPNLYCTIYNFLDQVFVKDEGRFNLNLGLHCTFLKRKEKRGVIISIFNKTRVLRHVVLEEILSALLEFGPGLFGFRYYFPVISDV